MSILQNGSPDNQAYYVDSETDFLDTYIDNLSTQIGSKDIYTV